MSRIRQVILESILSDAFQNQDPSFPIIARILGIRDDLALGDISLTNNNNLKISISELAAALSVNSNSQLRTSLYGITGNDLGINANNNAQIILNELAAAISTNSNTQLKTTIYGETGNAAAVTANNNLQTSLNEVGDTSIVDAFSRFRVSSPLTIFDSKQLYDKQPLFWDEELGGAATSIHSTVDAATTMTVTASASDYVIRQTKQWFNYQPGKSQLVFFTFLCTCQAGLTKRIGLFNGTGVNNLTPNNGIFFETDGATIADSSWNIAKNGATTESVSQPNWNVDTLDGNGPSGIIIDFNATQIGVIDYEWLGVGRVRVGFVINGIIYYCHYFNHANDSTFTSVYMSTPNLPLRYSIESDGTTGGDLVHICSSVISEGGVEKTGVLRSFNTGFTHLDGDQNTTYALIGIRLKSTHLGVTIDPESFSMINENNDDFRWALHLNPTISGTFTYSDVPNSSLQEAYGVTANTITNDGLIIDSGYASIDILSTSGALSSALKIGSTISGTVDELVLSVQPLSNGADIQGSLTVRELL